MILGLVLGAGHAKPPRALLYFHPPQSLSYLYLNHTICNHIAFDLIGFLFEWTLIINTKPVSDANIFSIALLNMLNNLKGTEDSNAWWGR